MKSMKAEKEIDIVEKRKPVWLRHVRLQWPGLMEGLKNGVNGMRFAA